MSGGSCFAGNGLGAEEDDTAGRGFGGRVLEGSGGLAHQSWTDKHDGAPVNRGLLLLHASADQNRCCGQNGKVHRKPIMGPDRMKCGGTLSPNEE